jgi:hypothetical protein
VVEQNEHTLRLILLEEPPKSESSNLMNIVSLLMVSTSGPSTPLYNLEASKRLKISSILESDLPTAVHTISLLMRSKLRALSILWSFFLILIPKTLSLKFLD